MQNKRFGSLSSSVDSNKLSQTVTGVLIMLAFLIIPIAHYFGFVVTDSQWADQAQAIGETAGLVVVTFGAIRKVVVWFFDKGQTNY